MMKQDNQKDVEFLTKNNFPVAELIAKDLPLLKSTKPISKNKNYCFHFPKDKYFYFTKNGEKYVVGCIHVNLTVENDEKKKIISDLNDNFSDITPFYNSSNKQGKHLFFLVKILLLARCDHI